MLLEARPGCHKAGKSCPFKAITVLKKEIGGWPQPHSHTWYPRRARDQGQGDCGQRERRGLQCT